MYVFIYSYIDVCDLTNELHVIINLVDIRTKKLIETNAVKPFGYTTESVLFSIKTSKISVEFFYYHYTS